MLVEAAEAGPNDVQVWATLPTHQKVASLFMHVVSLHHAIELYRKMHMAVPAEHHKYLDGLCEFIHLAATAKEDTKGSMLQKKWDCMTTIRTRESLSGMSSYLSLQACTAPVPAPTVSLQ